MTPATLSVFDLPERLAAKADPALIATDEQHFAAVAASLGRHLADLSDQLALQRRAPGGAGQAAMDRDLEIHRLTAQLRLLRRFGLDLCLGRMMPLDGSPPVYVGRIGLADEAGRRLLIDWRAPAAEPFFAATHARPLGLSSRRRYRWTRGRITDYWDEMLGSDGQAGNAALDDQSAFIASLGSSRSPRMRDVLSTIQADQDAIIRADSRGALVVEGGPGTGKTVVALHRAAYLLYSDPHLGDGRGGVLFVGPHPAYLAYIADVLPSLGEEGVQTCTVRDLVTEGAAAVAEVDPRVAALKSSVEMINAIEPAVGLYEELPTKALLVETDVADVWISATDWAEAFAAPDPGTPHNEARDEIWAALLEILVDKITEDADDDDGDDGEDFDAYGVGRADEHAGLRASLAADEDLVRAVNRSWPLLEATDIVGDLWTVPAYLRRCAPWLGPGDVAALQRGDAEAWTISDLPLLDAARQRLGDPAASRRRQRREKALAAERERMSDVVDHLIATDDSELKVMSMLRGQDLRAALVDPTAVPAATPDLLAGPFAHVVVDEAQELTDAEWQMLVRRCPSRSFTIVGDRAQARHGFTETWRKRLARVGFDRVKEAWLTVNYRTPTEIMAEAEPVIRAVFPEANVPTSIRSTGVPVLHGITADLNDILDIWLGMHADGVACVLGDPTFAATPRVRSLSPETAKGLEFDFVVLVDPDAFGTGIEGTVDRYVAMTRATQELVILTRSGRT